MTPLFLLLSILSLPQVAQAAPGRFVAGGSAALTPQGDPAVRVALDYGLKPHLSLGIEGGTLPAGLALGASAGPVFELLDSRWWRISAVAHPELMLPVQVEPWTATADPLELQLRAGGRVSWLALWGLSITARADRVLRWNGEPGWTELGLGGSVRL